MKRQSQRGSAMLITLILMAALLAGAAVLVSLQLSANRNTDLTRSGMTALYCAEAGLTASRTVVSANQDTWASWLGTDNEPTWLATVPHDVDGTGATIDWKVTLEDNFDETPPDNDAPGVDKDNRIFIVSKCIDPRFGDTPREVRELVEHTTITNCYNAQRGGCGGNGNMN